MSSKSLNCYYELPFHETPQQMNNPGIILKKDAITPSRLANLSSLGYGNDIVTSDVLYKICAKCDLNF